MNFRKTLLSKKYLFKIYLLISAIIFVFIIVFSAVVYFSVGNSLIENEISNSKKILVQMKYNVENIDETIRNACVTSFYNSDIYSALDGIRTMLIIIAFILILSALIAAIIISNRIYSPVAEILKFVKGGNSNNSNIFGQQMLKQEKGSIINFTEYFMYAKQRQNIVK